MYCQAHKPHKLIKNIELRKQRAIDDINQFAKILEKNYEILRKMDKHYDLSVFTPKKNISLTFSKNDNNKKQHILEKDKRKLIHLIRELLKSLSNMNVVCKKSNEGEYTLDHCKKGIKFTYEETKSPTVFPWYLVKLDNLSSFDCFNLYLSLVPTEYDYYRIILKKNYKKIIKKSLGLHIKEKIITIEDTKGTKVEVYKEDDQLYCYCKRKFLVDDFMISKLLKIIVSV